VVVVVVRKGFSCHRGHGRFGNNKGSIWEYRPQALVYLELPATHFSTSSNASVKLKSTWKCRQQAWEHLESL